MTPRDTRPHAHVWIDPTDPPIARAPYSPVIGDRRREMKRDRTYVCQLCGATVQPRAALRAAGVTR